MLAIIVGGPPAPFGSFGKLFRSSRFGREADSFVSKFVFNIVSLVMRSLSGVSCCSPIVWIDRTGRFSAAVGIIAAATSR